VEDIGKILLPFAMTIIVDVVEWQHSLEKGLNRERLDRKTERKGETEREEIGRRA